MRTLKLTIAYDGTRYAGWQVQRDKPTVQGTLERILRRILRDRVCVIGSGRTDAGVHALAQVAHVRTRSRLPGERLVRSANALLPRDISILKVEEVSAHFHAQFSARRKRYRYRVFTGIAPTPFIRPYVCQVRAPLDLGLMRREAGALRGRHDFRAFARSSGAGPHTKRFGVGAGTTVRSLTEVRLRRRGEELHFEFQGNGFLHTMVRSMTGTLLDIGRGRLPQGTVRRMLRSGDRRLAGMTAPAKGLALISVDYS